MKIGFIGTQQGMTNFQKISLLETLQHFKCSEFCHMDILKSAREGNDIALNFDIKVFTIFPPLDGKNRAWCFNPDHAKMNGSFYTILVNQMVDYKDLHPFPSEINVRWMPPDSFLLQGNHMVDNVDQVIACPKEHEHSLKSGVWAIIRQCWKRKRGITIIPPIVRDDETIDQFNKMV